jgi:hypothetical protein
MKAHLRDTELACLSDGLSEGGMDAGAAEHLRWCARCRSALADYRWLQGELAASLAVAADAVVVPRPRWRAVQGQLRTRRRQAAGWRASAFAGVALAICFLLLVPVLSPVAAAQSLPYPAMATAPTLAEAAASADSLAAATTPTPAALCEGAPFSATPAFQPLPIPTELGD